MTHVHSADASSSTTPAQPIASNLTGCGDDEQLCGICFTEVDAVHNPRGRLSSCDHLFCFYCISTWSKDTNVCPHCKARFQWIATRSNPTDADETRVKVRKRNYKGWEFESSDDDEDVSGSSGSASVSDAIRLSVSCAICGGSDNANRLIFCDRRTCSFIAHLDCLHLAEAPRTFLCATCDPRSGDVVPLTSVSSHQRDIELARRMEQEQLSAKRSQQHAAPSPVAVRATPVVARAGHAVAAASALALPPVTAQSATEDDDVPYYLKGANASSASIAQAQLRSRVESSQRARAMKAQITAAKRARPEEAPNATDALEGAAAPKQEPETLEMMERRLLKTYFFEQLAVVQRRRFIESNHLRLVGDGHIQASAPKLRVEEVALQEAARIEAMSIARRMTEQTMGDIRAAVKERAQREASRKAQREIEALKKLAEVVRMSRERAAAGTGTAITGPVAAALPAVSPAPHPKRGVPMKLADFLEAKKGFAKKDDPSFVKREQ